MRSLRQADLSTEKLLDPPSTFVSRPRTRNPGISATTRMESVQSPSEEIEAALSRYKTKTRSALDESLDALFPLEKPKWSDYDEMLPSKSASASSTSFSRADLKKDLTKMYKTDTISSLDNKIRSLTAKISVLTEELRATKDKHAQEVKHLESQLLFYQGKNLSQLSLDQLALLLDQNRQAYAQILATVKEKAKKRDETSTRECVVCLDAFATTACIPCGHLTLCDHCCTTVDRKCPICCATVTSFCRIFL